MCRGKSRTDDQDVPRCRHLTEALGVPEDYDGIVYKTVGNPPIKADVNQPDDVVVRPVEVWIPLRTF